MYIILIFKNETIQKPIRNCSGVGYYTPNSQQENKELKDKTRKSTEEG